ncbi:hypothetical protein M427DRAFT_30404 [Gonapodya prolifera JEL478]|uniref:MFS general substrate transporter n=1 Tax=Gonapodya prolifera (strain JEL478) TaxID=1344416 RepID=A0A139AME0_GONPJ|nr:hypothetical protein M427DRAFT_30404 [Gonapodya prolifera JEL478]|eukprot:KXS17615.1 hypothetical protein M427DRAFT_30404 [Gonapodya prolifera JEL478]
MVPSTRVSTRPSVRSAFSLVPLASDGSVDLSQSARVAQDEQDKEALLSRKSADSDDDTRPSHDGEDRGWWSRIRGFFSSKEPHLDRDTNPSEMKKRLLGGKVRYVGACYAVSYVGMNVAGSYVTACFGSSTSLLTLALLNSSFGIGSLLAPSACLWLGGGARRSMQLAAGTFPLYILAVTLVDLPLHIISSVLYGLGIGLMWFQQGMYVNRAYVLAGGSPGYFTKCFYQSFTINGIVGNILALILFRLKLGLVSVLWTMLCISCVGFLMFFFVDSLNEEESSPNEAFPQEKGAKDGGGASTFLMDILKTAKSSRGKRASNGGGEYAKLTEGQANGKQASPTNENDDVSHHLSPQLESDDEESDNEAEEPQSDKGASPTSPEPATPSARPPDAYSTTPSLVSRLSDIFRVAVARPGRFFVPWPFLFGVSVVVSGGRFSALMISTMGVAQASAHIPLVNLCGAAAGWISSNFAGPAFDGQGWKPLVAVHAATLLVNYGVMTMDLAGQEGGSWTSGFILPEGAKEWLFLFNGAMFGLADNLMATVRDASVVLWFSADEARSVYALNRFCYCLGYALIALLSPVLDTLQTMILHVILYFCTVILYHTGTEYVHAQHALAAGLQPDILGDAIPVQTGKEPSLSLINQTGSEDSIQTRARPRLDKESLAAIRASGLDSVLSGSVAGMSPKNLVHVLTHRETKLGLLGPADVARASSLASSLVVGWDRGEFRRASVATSHISALKMTSEKRFSAPDGSASAIDPASPTKNQWKAFQGPRRQPTLPGKGSLAQSMRVGMDSTHIGSMNLLAGVPTATSIAATSQMSGSFTAQGVASFSLNSPNGPGGGSRPLLSSIESPQRPGRRGQVTRKSRLGEVDDDGRQG